MPTDFQSWLDEQKQQGLQFPDQGTVQPEAPQASPSATPPGGAPAPPSSLAAMMQALQQSQQQSQPQQAPGLLGALGQLVKGAAQGFQSVAAPRTLPPAGQPTFEQRQQFEMMKNLMIYERMQELATQQQGAASALADQQARARLAQEAERAKNNIATKQTAPGINPEIPRHNMSAENIAAENLRQEGLLRAAQTQAAQATAGLSGTKGRFLDSMLGGGGDVGGAAPDYGGGLLPAPESATHPLNPPSSPGAAAPAGSLKGALQGMQLEGANVEGMNFKRQKSDEQIAHEAMVKRRGTQQGVREEARQASSETTGPVIDNLERIAMEHSVQGKGGDTLLGRAGAGINAAVGARLQTDEDAKNYNRDSTVWMEGMLRKAKAAGGQFTDRDEIRMRQAMPTLGWDTPAVVKSAFTSFRLMTDLADNGHWDQVKALLYSLPTGAAGASHKVDVPSTGQSAGAPAGLTPYEQGLLDKYVPQR